MYLGKRVIAIIPARGGSKGIPRKNIKPLHGRPLIAYAIRTALASSLVDRVLVSSDDEEILRAAERHGAAAYRRPPELADDSTPLDPVIEDAFKHEAESFDVVMTIQPTSPLLSPETLDAAIRTLVDGEKASVLTLTDRTHLYWKEKDGAIVPDFAARVNRQYLPKTYGETGAIIGCTAEQLLSTGTRINPRSSSFVVTGAAESVDVDTYHDWQLAEAILGTRRYGINVIGNAKTGLGHVYRQLGIALHLNAKPFFFVPEGHDLALTKIREHHYPVAVYANETQLLRRIADEKIGLLINDVLDTERPFIEAIKQSGARVVNFEDLGGGAEAADLTINDLYEFSRDAPNICYGHEYVCLRPDVNGSAKKAIGPDVENVLIACGGVDPANLTHRYLTALGSLGFRGAVKVVLGLGYRRLAELREAHRASGLAIDYVENVPTMADLILGADLVLSSNGRTVYETVAIGTPAIVMCQNAQEARHTFSNISGAVTNLGLAGEVPDAAIAESIRRHLDDFEFRKRLNERMLSFRLEEGVKRVLKLIQGIAYAA